MNPKLKCAIFCDGWAGISSPLNNTVSYLSNIYDVDVFYYKLPYKNTEVDIPKFNISNVVLELIEIPYKKLLFIEKLIIRILKVDFREWIYIKKIYKEKLDPALCIIMDKQVKLLGLVFYIKNIRYIYFSLELPAKPGEVNWLYRLGVKLSSKIFIQDIERAKKLKEIFQLRKARFSIILNSSIGKIQPAKNNYFKDKFCIADNVKIVLMVGTISAEHGFYDIIDTVLEWPTNYNLVIHGWLTDDDIRKYIYDHSQFNKKIFLSEDVLPFDDKLTIFQSSDIGIVYFKPVNINYEYAAGSSGKLFDFMQCGIPIIANRISGMKELIEDNKIGILINSSNEWPSLFRDLEKNYNEFRSNELQLFPRFEFSSSISKALIGNNIIL
jgi:glycosyltransferase involved in cell wall biosynthesis